MRGILIPATPSRVASAPLRRNPVVLRGLQLDRFDAVAEILGRTRTSLLVSFMQQFCLDQVVEIEKRNHKLDQLSAALERQRILAEQRGYLSSVPVHRDARDDDLPGMFVSDGWEGF